MAKQIYIHVGPAKTGSSAIQKFMLQNPALLRELGIMYPPHTLMESGVSVGNYNAIYYENEKRNPSTNKIAKLINLFEKSDARVLLLSSENFFGPINELAEVIPQAKFIFYLRNPLTLAESLYNQNVKNFGETEPFEIKTRRPNFGTIGHLRDFVKKYGSENLIIRYFDKSMFHRGNIINDLLFTMGIDPKESTPNQKVNLAYTLEALEVKRFLNHFNLNPYCDYLLNNLLQQNQDGTTSYSLLKPEEFDKHLQHVIDEIQLFFKEIPCDQSEAFLKTIRQTKQKEYIPQTLSVEKLAEIRDYICRENTPLYYKLCRLIEIQDEQSTDDKVKTTAFIEKYNPQKRLLYHLKYISDRALFINRLRINKFLS
ncbi:hypothetical protein [Owenweeksia hongkongensis]|uniref:hypothetical protein n=1 Tax=Owenweeksia hongkongensis TaxID=253245 RepID=UPI003A90DB08